MGIDWSVIAGEAGLPRTSAVASMPRNRWTMPQANMSPKSTHPTMPADLNRGTLKVINTTIAAKIQYTGAARIRTGQVEKVASIPGTGRNAGRCYADCNFPFKEADM